MSMGRVTSLPQKCQQAITLPISYRGPINSFRNVIFVAPPPVLEPECKHRSVKNESLQGEGFNIQTHVMSTTCQSFPNNLQGANKKTQKCLAPVAPTQFRPKADRRNSMQVAPKGASRVAQKCHHVPAPAIFIWCQGKTAEMLLLLRTKGRAVCLSQKCYKTDALPNQFNGVIVKTQKCQDIVSPRGPRRNRRNAKVSSPPPNLGHHSNAKMPKACRPITRGQHLYAEMPTPIRLAT